MKNKLRALGKLQIFLSGFLVAFTLILAGCGGGGGGGGGGIVGGGIGGTGAVGTVSAIGSVTVNGVTYSCVGATVTNDDGTVDQGPGDNCIAARDAGRLSVGSIVVVTGSKDANGNFTATTVSTSRNVLGPVANKDDIGLSFTVLNQRVLVVSTTRFEINAAESFGTTGLTGLINGKTVEVSGFRNANGDILATLVETKSVNNNEFELKGFFDSATVTIGGVSINLNGQVAPASGACVEAKGSFSVNTLTLIQPLKSDDDCNGGRLSGTLVQAEVEGVIDGFVSVRQFNIGNQKVTTIETTTYEGGTSADLLSGVKVQAEGTISGDTLTAKKIQIKSNGVRIEGVTDSPLSGGSFTILGITVKVVTATENSLGPITAGTRLRLEGSKSGATQVTAAKISNASGGGGTRAEIRGPLDADANPASPNFTILGAQVQTSGSTQFNGSTSGSMAFFANTKKDQIVKARGNQTNNVIAADEVENEN